MPPQGDLVRADVTPMPIGLPRIRLALAEMFVVIIDTSVITSDVIKSVKGGLPSPLYLAMERGLVRGYMAHHTWAEVPRVLARRAPTDNCDFAAVEKRWWDRYVKLIRFVPTADLPPSDPELEKALGAGPGRSGR